MPRPSVKGCAASAWALLALSGAVGRAQIAPAAVRCADEVSAQRRTWAAVSPPIVQPPIAGGDQLRHWPTAALGVWLVEHTTGSESTLTRVGPDGLVRVRWSPTCAPTRDERPRPAAMEPAFTDRDLTALLGRRTGAVIYLWSPHMPLSVDGYGEVRRAAEARQLEVVVLLDPQANRPVAAAAIRQGRLPRPALRVADSVELQFRELALHAPSLAVIDRGRIVGSLLRGYRSAEEYGAFLDRVLAGW
jgi:hypothetical protein